MKITRYSFLQWWALCLLITAVVSCSPDFSDTGEDIHTIDPSRISRVEVKPQNLYILANGKATMEFTPIVYYNFDGKEYKLRQERVNKDWFTFTASKGTVTNGTFTTDDQQLVGQNIEVAMAMKSNPDVKASCSFTVVAPPEPMEDITIPVVFHVLRNSGDEQRLGYTFNDEVVMQVLDKMNKVLAGEIGNNPVGVDTHIRLKAAVYAPDGRRLSTPGINRVTLPEGTLGQTSIDFQTPSKLGLVWDYNKYLNIWLCSVATEVPIFGTLATIYTTPAWVYPESVATMPTGLGLKAYGATSMMFPTIVGIMYHAEKLNNPIRPYADDFGFVSVNDIMFSVGRYFGLKENSTFKKSTPPNNLVTDVPAYGIDEKYIGSNKTDVKETDKCFFLSENIMDDAPGYHTSISLQQARIMRWVIKNCPERAAYKSSFAFTGQD